MYYVGRVDRVAGYTRHVYAGGAGAYHTRAPAVPLNANITVMVITSFT
ncbi:hypothetical protein KGM_206302 [Danaus plexippus plexippus]|uniref:Uncharacterized protein n=1 Tax=Danaus plexippus plexippus TaxID=278856 RepID=A0A212EP49_DANPL|nr:hypothetical protein KGM_206302 [Danaus plexippus plexippus]